MNYKTKSGYYYDMMSQDILHIDCKEDIIVVKRSMHENVGWEGGMEGYVPEWFDEHISPWLTPMTKEEVFLEEV